MAGSVVFVTITDVTTLMATTAFTTLKPPLSKTVTTEGPTTIPPLPSQFEAPTPSSSVPAAPAKSVVSSNNTVANIVLVSIIMIALLYIGIIIFGIMLWYKGKCPNCNGLETKVRKIEEGQYKVITKDMCKERDQANAQRQRASALANLEAKASQAISKYNNSEIHHTFWPIVGRESRRTPQNTSRPTTPGPESGLGHGNMSTIHGPIPSENVSSSLPASSIYSDPCSHGPEQPKEVFRNNRYEIISHFEPYMGGGTTAPGNHRPYFSGAWKKAMDMHYNNEAYMRRYSDERREEAARTALQNAAFDQAPTVMSSAYSPSSPLANTPYHMERVNSDDPDAQAYRNAASAAAELGNPDAPDARRYADRLLQDIRARQNMEPSRTYGNLPHPDEFDLESKANTSGGVVGSKWVMKGKKMFGLSI